MTPHLWTYARLAVLLLVSVWFLAAPAEAQRRNPQSSDRNDAQQAAPAPSSGPRAVPRTSEPAPSPRASEPARSPRTSDAGGDGDGEPARAGGRDRGSKPAIGEAVPRTTPPPSGDRDPDYVSGGYGPGYGYGAYGYGGYGYGGYGYGGYGYGGYYDPYGGYARYPVYYDEGKLRLKMKPTEAAVYVDGYYAGVVDDFDGIFQRLRLEAGYHRIEIQEPGFQPLVVDLRIEPGRTTTYRGILTRMP